MGELHGEGGSILSSFATMCCCFLLGSGSSAVSAVDYTEAAGWPRLWLAALMSDC
jgi:hypothetical protein